MGPFIEPVSFPGHSNMRLIVTGMILTLAALVVLAPQPAAAQSALYVSNLGGSSGSPLFVGSTEWIAAEFATGTNVGGYELNSIQLAMARADLPPGPFSVMLFGDNNGQPGSSVGVLEGNLDPVTPGTYTYTASDVALSSSTAYWVVATSGAGLYFWNETLSGNYDSANGWSMNLVTASSPDGARWFLSNSEFPQFGVNATAAVPEPQSFALFTLACLIACLRRRAILRESTQGKALA